MYFAPETLKKLLRTLSKKFSGGELMFDASSKLGVKITNKKIKKEGKNGMEWKSYVGKSPNQFIKIHQNIKVLDIFSYWDHTPINPEWKKITKKLIKISTFLKMGKFVHLRFL